MAAEVMVMQNIFYFFGSLALITYIANNLSVPISYIKDTITTIKLKRLETAPPSYDDLPSVFRAPTAGSGREIGELEDLSKYKDKLFDEGEYNRETGIFTQKAVDALGEQYLDIYEKEVSR